jgi:hypothetical protein
MLQRAAQRGVRVNIIVYKEVCQRSKALYENADIYDRLLKH